MSAEDWFSMGERDRKEGENGLLAADGGVIGDLWRKRGLDRTLASFSW